MYASRIDWATKIGGGWTQIACFYVHTAEEIQLPSGRGETGKSPGRWYRAGHQICEVFPDARAGIEGVEVVEVACEIKA
jgi:hypothetical protein